jgi:hypothetical protein
MKSVLNKSLFILGALLLVVGLIPLLYLLVMTCIGIPGMGALRFKEYADGSITFECVSSYFGGVPNGDFIYMQASGLVIPCTMALVGSFLIIISMNKNDQK